MKKNGESPVIRKRRNPPKAIKITFPEAIQAVKEGRRITKLEWGNIKIYGVLRNGLLMLHKDDGRDYQWLVSEGDLMGEDWIILPESN